MAKAENVIDTTAERGLNTTWERAIGSSLLDQKTQIGPKVTRKGFTAGDPKRRSFQYRSHAR